MDRVAFITDIDTPLGESLVRLYLEENNQVIATVSSPENSALPEDFSHLKESAGDSLLIEPWNRHSPISAKNVYLKAITHFNRLDEVLLIGNNDLSCPLLHQVGFEVIERAIDSWIKGNLFFLKSILARFLEKGGGILALISIDFNHPTSALEETLRHSFLGLARSLLQTYGNKGINVNAFESSVNQIDEFSRYIYRNLTERGRKDSGRWLRYRSGILSGLRTGSQ